MIINTAKSDPTRSPVVRANSTEETRSTPVDNHRDVYTPDTAANDSDSRWMGPLKGACVFGLPALLGAAIHPLAGAGVASVPLVHAYAVTHDQGAAGRSYVGLLGAGLALLPKPWALAGAGALTALGAVIGSILAADERALRETEGPRPA